VDSRLQGRPAAMGNFDYAGPLTEMVLLGNVAIRPASASSGTRKK